MPLECILVYKSFVFHTFPHISHLSKSVTFTLARVGTRSLISQKACIIFNQLVFRGFSLRVALEKDIQCVDRKL